PHREQALNWLRVAGSKEGQEALNPLKGSFCARIDCDPTKFDGYWQSAGKDYVKNVLVPSEVHGSAAPPAFTVAFNDIVSQFVSKRDVVAAQSELQNACSDNKMCPKGPTAGDGQNPGTGGGAPLQLRPMAGDDPGGGRVWRSDTRSP